MSWSVSASGKKQEVLASVGKQFDDSASNYLEQGMREGNDVAALRAVVLGSIHTLKPEEGGGVEVSCYGSRGDDSYMSVSLSVKTTAAPPPPAPPAPPETKPDVAK